MPKWIVVRGYIPNTITVIRFGSPFYLSLLLGPALAFWYLLAAVVTAVSDWVDGYLAKRWRCASPLGAQLDIYSDKIFCWTMGAHAIINSHFSAWYWVPVAVIVLYDVIVIVMRLMRNLLFAPSNIAKLKTFVEMAALNCIFVPAGLEHAMRLVGLGEVGNMTWFDLMSLVGLWAAGVGTIWSGFHYAGWVGDVPAFWTRTYWAELVKFAS